MKIYIYQNILYSYSNIILTLGTNARIHLELRLEREQNVFLNNTFLQAFY